MVIELLKFKVAPNLQENFIYKDAEIGVTQKLSESLISTLLLTETLRERERLLFETLRERRMCTLRPLRFVFS